MGGYMRLRNKKTGEIKEYTHTTTSYHVPIKGGYEIFTPWKPEEWEELEDVKEPLIKDEKIRKAVRAWAEANDIEDGITYLDNGEFRSYLNTTIDFAILVDEHRFDLLKKSEEYTITELCGEEEE